MDPVRARKTHCRTDPGHVSRAAHAQQLARKRDSRAKTRATGRVEDSWENSSDRYRSEDTSQWSELGDVLAFDAPMSIFVENEDATGQTRIGYCGGEHSM